MLFSRFIFSVLATLTTISSLAQLKAGFQKEELITLLQLSSHQVDTPWKQMDVSLPENFSLVYRSKVMALENRFDIWLNAKESYVVINTRGTTGTRASWLENFHAAMVTANGSIQISDSTIFEYKLADNPRAAVHVGWLIGMSAIAPSVVTQIHKYYKKGIRDFYLSGHSQGGGITFLLTAYLYNLQKDGVLPADIRFKTYCTAGPKPGNLYFAYDYEFMTRGGWAFNVVNSLDWVPEVPFSIQTVNNFNELSPFKDAKSKFKEFKLPVRWALNHIYKDLGKHPEKSKRKFQKYLGKRAASIIIKKELPGYIEPEYFDSNHFMRCGNQVILIPTEDYLKTHPGDPENIFSHHLPAPYLFLAKKMEGY